jgi:large subunit ribosomal protein L35Ae
MEATIVNYKAGRHTQVTNQMIIVVNSVDTREKAQKFVGKTVVWASPADKKIKGEIRSAHGNKGAMRVLFETGMPGQAISSKVKIE